MGHRANSFSSGDGQERTIRAVYDLMDTSGSVGPLRVARACISCAELRKKCTGESPCENCVRRGCECEYAAAKRPGPKPGERTARLHAELASLREEVAALKAHIGWPADVPFTSAAAQAPSSATVASAASALKRSALAAAASQAAIAASHAAASALGDGRAGRGLAATKGVGVGFKRPRPAADNASVASSGTAPSVASTAGAADPKFDPWQPPGAIIPSAEEMAILRIFFDQTNFVMPCVDEEAFWAALEEAKYYTGGEEDDRDEHDDEAEDEAGQAHDHLDVDTAGNGTSLSAGASAAAVDVPATHSGAAKSGLARFSAGGIASAASKGAGKAAALLSAGSSGSAGAGAGAGAGSSNPLAPAGSPPAPSAGVGARTLARHANAYGFRVLFHIVLAGGCIAKSGQQALARYHYNLARAFLGPCMTAPSQHLVSALLIMVGA